MLRERIVGYLEPQIVQVELREHGDGAGIAFVKGMDLPEKRDSVAEVLDLVVLQADRNRPVMPTLSLRRMIGRPFVFEIVEAVSRHALWFSSVFWKTPCHHTPPHRHA